jgi:low temperature requirement protein LtrA
MTDETDPGTTGTPGVEQGKRVAWVELYLDLVFVLAISELAHLIVDEPRVSSVFTALGLFVCIWWTWIGFAVLYNRHGADSPRQRIVFLLASAPISVAAIATIPTAHGHAAGFGLSLAASRLLLVCSFAYDDHPDSSVGDAQRRSTAIAYAISALVFVIAVWVPPPFRAILWGAAIAQESRVLFRDSRRHRTQDTASAEDSAQLDPGEVIDAAHFAERFGLFLILLLGELVIQAGEAQNGSITLQTNTWVMLVAAVVLAGALWWAYFNATADFDEKALEISGGSPGLARVLFAIGHMLPAFALLLTAAGIGLLTHHDPPRIGFGLAAIGVAFYLSSARVASPGVGVFRRVLLVVLVGVTYAFGVLHYLVGPVVYLWILALWTVLNAALTPTPPEPTESMFRRPRPPIDR